MPAVHALRKRLGRRCSVLLGIGAMEVVYGLGVAIDPRYGIVRGVSVLTHWLPMAYWGSLWMICGTLALVLAFEPRSGWSRYGFAAATLPMTLWSAANLVAWLTGEFGQAWTSFFTWGVWAVIVTAINRWPEYNIMRGGSSYGA